MWNAYETHWKMATLDYKKKVYACHYVLRYITRLKKGFNWFFDFSNQKVGILIKSVYQTYYLINEKKSKKEECN